LENQLKQYQAPEVSAEEMKAFIKVSQVLTVSDWVAASTSAGP